MKAMGIFAVGVLAFGTAFAETVPSEPVQVDIQRYSGVWYEIASIPQDYQADCTGNVKAEYTVLSDNALKVVNSCTMENGEVKTVEGRAQLKDAAVANHFIVSFKKAEAGATDDGSADDGDMGETPDETTPDEGAADEGTPGEEAPVEETAAGDDLKDWDFADAGDYVILAVSDDYSYALVGHPEREAAWVLARTPSLPSDVLITVNEQMQKEGYDTCDLQMTVQDNGVEQSAPLCEAAQEQKNLIYQGEAGDDVLAVLENQGQFNEFLGALEAAGLSAELTGEGPVTVFAPTNQAFNSLSVEQKSQLFGDKAVLTAVMRGHWTTGAIASADLANKTDAVDSAGNPLTFAANGESMTVNGSTIVMADVKAGNGVIHVIDTMIWPQQTPAPQQ